jgi:hypothetical protein
MDRTLTGQSNNFNFSGQVEVINITIKHLRYFMIWLADNINEERLVLRQIQLVHCYM